MGYGRPMSMEMKAASPANNLVACLLVSAVMVAADVWMGPMLVRQWQTRGYQTAEGTITVSQLEETVGPKRRSYSFHVRYSYEVAGRRYDNNEFLYSPIIFNRSRALDLRERFPLKATVPVYYSPRNPWASVLLKGLQGTDLLWLLILFPLHLFALGFWYAFAKSLGRRSDRLGAFVLHGRTHVPVSLGLDAGAWVAGGILVVGLLLLFVEGFSPPVGLLELLWTVALGAVGFTVWRWLKAQRSGALELILDERHERLSLPPMFGRSERVHFPLSRVLGLRIDLEQRVVGKSRRVVTSYKPILILWDADIEGGREELTLAKWDEDPERAEALVSWLEQRSRRALRSVA